VDSNYSDSLLVHFRRVEALRFEALECKLIDLSSRQLCDLELLLNRGLYPLGAAQKMVADYADETGIAMG